MITKFKAENFTVFTKLDIEFSPGINIIIGENDTGKTHLIKAIYSACSLVNDKTGKTLDQKVAGVFMPNSIGRLVHRSQGRKAGSFTVYRRNENDTRDHYINLHITTLGKAETKQSAWREETDAEVTFIPVKDMLANAPGFRSLFQKRELAYEEVYVDIIDKAFLPITKGKLSRDREKLLNHLQKAMDGKVIDKNETFYLKNKSGELEFPLLAEGYRKLGLLYRLIQNDTLTRGSVLFWDEPEANLNPKLSEAIVNVLLELQRMGVQIFITTHDYVLLQEFDLATQTEDRISYHVLYKNEEKEICHDVKSNIDELQPNDIDATFTKLLDRRIQKGIKALNEL